MSARAALFVDVGAELVVEDVDLVDPGPRDVIVSIEASGVCHSDLSVLEGHTGGRPPMVLGHEGAAVVEWVGSEVSRVTVGQRVVLSLMPVCGVCWHCLRQETHLCELGGALFLAPRIKRGDGSEANALMGLGTFAETALVNEASCVPVETDLPSEQLALIGCGVTTGLGAVFNTAKVGPGATVAVIGSGGVGSSVVQGARISGAAHLIVVDPERSKRDAALAFGATDVVDPADGDSVEQVLALTSGRGVDFAFEAVGSPALITQAMAMTRRGGTTVLVGLPDHHAELTMPVVPLILQDRTIKGSYYGSARSTRDIPKFVDLIEQGRLDLGSMITRRFDLDHVNDAFTAMRTRQAIRSVIV
jgi:S-(hydroxymethyl)glutathione dehydrogenase/alcohol dehydrogenase